MVAVSSLNFSVYEQYTSDTAADGSTSQSGSLQAGVTVGTDDGSSYGSSIILDVTKAPASKKLSDGLKAVNTLTQVASYARTQAPKDAAAGRLARAIGELRTLDLFGGGIRAVEQAVRIAQEIAGAVRDLAQAEEGIAEGGGGSSDGAAAASAGAAASAALSAALSGSSSPPAAAPVAVSPSAPADPTASTTAAETGYAGQAGTGVTSLVASAAGLGSGAGANRQAATTLSQALLGELQAAGLPVDGANLQQSLQDLITNPLAGGQELQASARQAGLDVTVATSLDVTNTLTDPRNAAAKGLSAAAAVDAIDDPYDGLIRDAVAALSAIGKGLRKALPPLLNSPDRKIAHRAKKAEDAFGQAVADTVKSIGDYYNAKAEVEAEGITEAPPSPIAKAAIDAANATIDGTGDDETTDATETAADAIGTPAVGADGTPAISAGSVAGTSIAVHVSVNIQV